MSAYMIGITLLHPWKEGQSTIGNEQDATWMVSNACHNGVDLMDYSQIKYGQIQWEDGIYFYMQVEELS